GRLLLLRRGRSPVRGRRPLRDRRERGNSDLRLQLRRSGESLQGDRRGFLGPRPHGLLRGQGEQQPLRSARARLLRGGGGHRLGRRAV
ncbi:MAG: Diaminopimelate decarboxylase, partial [uncultured Rubrobacteraceae bacterium]